MFNIAIRSNNPNNSKRVENIIYRALDKQTKEAEITLIDDNDFLINNTGEDISMII